MNWAILGTVVAVLSDLFVLPYPHATMHACVCACVCVCVCVCMCVHVSMIGLVHECEDEGDGDRVWIRG